MSRYQKEERKRRDERRGGILIIELFEKCNTFYYYLKGVKVFFISSNILTTADTKVWW